MASRRPASPRRPAGVPPLGKPMEEANTSPDQQRQPSYRSKPVSARSHACGERTPGRQPSSGAATDRSTPTTPRRQERPPLEAVRGGTAGTPIGGASTPSPACSRPRAVCAHACRHENEARPPAAAATSGGGSPSYAGATRSCRAAEGRATRPRSSAAVVRIPKSAVPAMLKAAIERFEPAYAGGLASAALSGLAVDAEGMVSSDALTRCWLRHLLPSLERLPPDAADQPAHSQQLLLVLRDILGEHLPQILMQQLTAVRNDPSAGVSRLTLGVSRPERAALLRVVQTLLDGSLGAVIEHVGEALLGLPALHEEDEMDFAFLGPSERAQAAAVGAAEGTVRAMLEGLAHATHRFRGSGEPSPTGGERGADEAWLPSLSTRYSESVAKLQLQLSALASQHEALRAENVSLRAATTGEMAGREAAAAARHAEEMAAAAARHAEEMAAAAAGHAEEVEALRAERTLKEEAMRRAHAAREATLREAAEAARAEAARLASAGARGDGALRGKEERAAAAEERAAAAEERAAAAEERAAAAEERAAAAEERAVALEEARARELEAIHREARALAEAWRREVEESTARGEGEAATLRRLLEEREELLRQQDEQILALLAEAREEPPPPPPPPPRRLNFWEEMGGAARKVQRAWRQYAAVLHAHAADDEARPCGAWRGAERSVRALMAAAGLEAYAAGRAIEFEPLPPVDEREELEFLREERAAAEAVRVNITPSLRQKQPAALVQIELADAPAERRPPMPFRAKIHEREGRVGVTLHHVALEGAEGSISTVGGEAERESPRSPEPLFSYLLPPASASPSEESEPASPTPPMPYLSGAPSFDQPISTASTRPPTVPRLAFPPEALHGGGMLHI
ncbi:hypothetical protein AB1Y20_011870 [Prymnesium parvum]|uniref:Uncharacterized protein n=1 Tax=Prymnesium parvum TaxID=97485 RepID=A0AB34IIM8_PRYPA